MIEKLYNYFKRNYIFYFFLILFLFLFYNSLKFPLFKDPLSTVIVDRNGQLLSARIANDGQWRFPDSDSVPEKFKISIKYFEDEYFDYHPGFNPVSLIRAIYQNINKDEIVSGGSTITMQTIRLSRKGKSRTYLEKIKEILLSLRLEFSLSKSEILKIYVSNAPFGGNVVGLEAASWRYFNRSPHLLSWGESAMLAVLPNAPSLIYPGKNHDLLKNKRDRLLIKLRDKNIIDSITCELSMLEPIPERPKTLPQLTPHLLDRLILDGQKGKICRVNIDRALQIKLNKLVERNHDLLRYNEIHNSSILVIDVKKKSVLGYVGNSNCKQERCGSNVDMINSRRSTGSTLKPLLYAAILDEGYAMPHSLVPDVPTQIHSFSPKNFFKTFDGAVASSNALIRSLNIPSVLQLSEYGQHKFYDKLKLLGIKSLNNQAKHYGLSLILGGGEVSMWELGTIYTGMASVLNNHIEYNYRYDENAYSPPSILVKDMTSKVLVDESHFSFSSIWKTFEVLCELVRPIEEGQWESFSSSSKIAWKTGTSFGNRDAWAVGVSPEYVVVVWVGNSDGEGRPGLTGTKIAAPIMFNVFDLLPKTTWFSTPYNDLVEMEICDKSGDLPSIHCNKIITELVPKSCVSAKQCKYHRTLHLTSDSLYIVNSECYEVSEMVHSSWFVLPPLMSYYYKMVDPFYQQEPDVFPGCDKDVGRSMEIVYPKNGSQLFLPRDLDGNLNKAIFKLAHKRTGSIVYWHLNNKYIGKTRSNHSKKMNLPQGSYDLTVVDDEGFELKTQFEIIQPN